MLDDGGYRVVTPEATWATYRHLVSDLVGGGGALGPTARRGTTPRVRRGAEAEDIWDAGESFAHRFFRVPRRIDPTTVIEWTEVENLTGGPPRLLPSSLVWFGHPESADGGYAACSNGAAAGNTVDEATLQGLFELIERDSVALWWYPRARRPGVDLDSADDPRIRQALAQLDVEGRHSWVLYLTSDLGVRPMSPRTPQWMVRTCCLASVPTSIRSSPACGPRQKSHTSQVPCPSRASSAARAPQKTPEWPRSPPTVSRGWPHPPGSVASKPETRSVAQTLQVMLDQLSQRGLEVLRVQATRRDIGLPVVRVIALGLRHFWNRFAPGRLYDVPVQLGWVPTEFGEADLNPRWMFL